MKNVGELQNKILEHLAQYPNRSKTEIAKGLGYNHPGNVSKQTSKLEAKQFVKVSSNYKVRGSNRERWSLTADGISYFIEQSDYSIQDLITIISIYKEQKPAELLYNIIETMEKMGVPPDRVLSSFFINNEQIFSSIRRTGTALHILEEMIVREIWEAPIYESVMDDSGSNKEIRFFRNKEELFEREQFDEDIFDWILRFHVDKIDDYDTFAKNCCLFFPLVFENWSSIKQYGLDLWVKIVLKNVYKYLHLKTIERLSRDIYSRYTHQDFIEDIYSYIFGPSIYVPENAVIKTPKIELKRFITSTPEVRNFILKRRSENISLREKEEEYEDLFVKNFLV
jgi:hypothetical protein